MRRFLTLLCAMLMVVGLLAACTPTDEPPYMATPPTATESQLPPSDTASPTENNMTNALADLPPYAGEAATAVNSNKPLFTDQDKDLAVKGGPVEFYSELDNLGRCGQTYANVGKETMPTEERGDIGMIKPSGWKTVRYDDLVDGKYLYNRCHLIGYQLTGENANPQNLITGTRYLNVQGMLPYENEVAVYVERTCNHVLYRVTPIFTGNNLVADGVLMEAWSVEDKGEGVEFCAYCYNVQPGVIIDYATGDSRADKTYVSTTESPIGEVTYILNTRSKKFHRPDCSGADTISEHNRKDTDKSRETLVTDGYSPCGSCNP